MKTWRIIQKKENEIVVWSFGCTMNKLKADLQYLLDNIKNLDDFYVVNAEDKKAIKAYVLSTSFFGLHKRTFMEKNGG